LASEKKGKIENKKEIFLSTIHEKMSKVLLSHLQEKAFLSVKSFFGEIKLVRKYDKL